MEDKNLRMARALAAAVREAGGRCYYVGGFVRDGLLGNEGKDIDIEVHGVPVETLERILDSLGERMTLGASFGIFGLRGYELDIAMPRSETATGRGHRDFAVFVDPYLGEEKAARRRDFTINAMMRDVLTGEILDFFGGREDLARGVIRHVNGESYLEDPLRVLRAAQFAARFGFTIAEETRALSAKADLTALAGERIFGELEKALCKAARPSVFFEELKSMGQLSVWFAEPEALIGVEQNPAYHPEGDAWIHTIQVLDEAAALRHRAKEPLWYMLAALCHDFGKAVAIQWRDGVAYAYGHETLGLPLVRRFLERMTRETRLLDYVLNMTEMHMGPHTLTECGAKTRSYMKLYDRSVCPEDLILLAKADKLGCCGPDTDLQAHVHACAQAEETLRGMLAEYRERMSRPCVMGRDLIEAGVEPGPLFSGALRYAHKLQLAAVPKEEQLRQTLGWLRSEQKRARSESRTRES